MSPKQLKRLRIANDMTQTELANKLGVTQTYISQLENGVHPISDRIAFKVAYLLEVTPEFVQAITNLRVINST